MPQDAPRLLPRTPPRKSDADLIAIAAGEAVIAVGVLQGRSVVRDEPASQRRWNVRNGGEFVSLTLEQLALWSVALVPTTPEEYRAAVTAELSEDDSQQALAFLRSENLLAMVRSGPTWTALSKHLRVLPRAYGLGNSAENEFRYAIQAPGNELMLQVDAASYLNWLSWDGTRTVYEGAVEVAAELETVADPSGAVDLALERARTLLIACLNAGFAFVEYAAAPLSDGRS
jgi:hypothetical protein